MENNFDENTFKNYYYQPLSDEESTELVIGKESLKRKRDEDGNIDALFDFTKTKKKKQFQSSSSVSRSQSGGIAFISTNEDNKTDSSHLVKIEIYDIKQIAKIPANEVWKHTKLRVKYYTKDTNKIFNKVIYDITKDISATDSCKKYIFNNKD